MSRLLSDDGPRSVPPPGLLLQKLVQPSGPAGRQRLAGLLLPAVSIRNQNVVVVFVFQMTNAELLPSLNFSGLFVKQHVLLTLHALSQCTMFEKVV